MRSVYDPAAVKFASDGTLFFADGYLDGFNSVTRAFRFLRVDQEGRVNSVTTGAFNPNEFGSGHEFQIQPKQYV